MKKVITGASLFALAVVLFSACKKSDDVTTTTLQKLQAKWNFQKSYEDDYFSGTHHYDTSLALAGDYLDFRTDGKAYAKFGTEMDTAFYSLIGDTRIATVATGTIPFTDTFDIQVLTDNALQIHSKQLGSSPDYDDVVDFFVK